MKKFATLLIAITLTFFGLKSHAQSFDGGLTAGVVASQINGDGYGGFHQIGWTAGVFGRIPTDGPSSWQLEMKYSLFGAHSDSKELDAGKAPMDIRLHYVELPIMYRYNLGGININGRRFDFITLEAGLSGDFMIKNSQSADNESGFENSSYLFFSVTGNVGMQFDINDRLGINIRSMNSLTPCRLTPNAGSYVLHWFNIVLQATVTYTIFHAGY
jgi:hypothetical protein